MTSSDSQEIRAASHNPNRARDHLANERTYLSWMRTSVALMGFGVVIARLRFLQSSAQHPSSHGWELGLLFALVGLAMILFATFHFFHVQKALETDSYQPSGRWILVSTLAIMLIGSGVLFYVFTMPVVAPVAPQEHLLAP